MKNVFTRLTAKTLKANRTRTMVTIIGILLATAMLTAVTTFISSLQHYMLENVIAENGDWHGEAMQIPEKKVEELGRNERSHHAGHLAGTGLRSGRDKAVLL